MTIGATVKRVVQTGTGSASVFYFNAPVAAVTDLTVYTLVLATGVQALQTRGGSGTYDYAVSINSSTKFATITLNNNLPNTHQITILRNVALTQEVDYVEGDPFSAETHEGALDKLTTMSTMLSEQIDRSLQFRPSSGVGPVTVEYDATASNNANKTLTWDANGTAIVNSDFTAGTLATQAADAVNIDGGAIDGTTIGGSAAAAGTFSTMTATTSNLGTLGAAVNANNQNITNIDVDSGAIDGTVIGGASAAAGSFTTVTASSHIVTSANLQGAITTGTTQVVTPEVTMSGSTLNVGTSASGGTVYLGHTTSETTVNDNLTVTGDLTVNGTTITANATTITVDDKNIELGSVASPSDATADGGGITLKGATDKTLLWDNANDNWTSNQHWNISTGKEFKINNASVLNATTLGSAVVNSSLTSVGTLTGLSVSGNSTVGTVTSGAWNGTAITPQYGGTGQNLSSSTGALKISSGTVSAGTLDVSLGGTGQTSYTNGQLLIGNTTGNTLTKATLTAGAGVSITNGTGSITIGASIIQGEAEGTAAAMALALGG